MGTRESIDELLNATEGEHYQFKEWKTKNNLREAAKICCALANCGGGKLVLGISDKRPRKVVGTMAFPQPERIRVDLMNKLRIGVDFYVYQHENGRVLVFDVASRPIGLPIAIESGAWWYHGDSLIMMPEEIRRAIYAESDHDFSGDVCPGATFNDLDSSAIETFRQKWGENSGNKRLVNLSAEQLLRDCGALTDDGVTYAAMILFGKCASLQKYLPHAEIVFEYRSSEAAGPAAHRVEFHEGFFNNVDSIWDLVNLRNNKQHYHNGFYVHPVPTFNEDVVREALLNAVSHRDYKLGGSIFIRQYSQRIEIESPGGFPWGISVENILDKQLPRNKLIAKIFQLSGLVERAGQGMNMIYEMTIREAKPLPDFSGSDAYFVKLTLNGKVFDLRMLQLIKKLGEKTLDAMTTDDYLLIVAAFTGKGLENIHPSRFEHLLELGVVKQTELGIDLINGDLMLALNNYPANEKDEVVNDGVNVKFKPVKDGMDELDEVVNEDVLELNEVVNDGVNESDEVVNYGINRQAQIILALKENPRITIKQLSKQLGVSKATTERTIRIMKNTQIIRVGSDKTGYWEVIE